MQTEKDAETLGFLIMNLEDGEDPKMLKGATFVRSFRNEPHYTL